MTPSPSAHPQPHAQEPHPRAQDSHPRAQDPHPRHAADHHTTASRPHPAGPLGLGLGDAPSASLNAPGSTTVSCILMQDAVAAGKVSVGPGKRPGTLDGTTALFANPYLDSKEEALVVNESGNLAYLRRAATQTGWAQDEVADASGKSIPAGEVVVVVHPQDLEIWALYTPVPAGPPQALLLTATTDKGVTTCSWKQVSGAVNPNFGTVTGLSNLYVYYDARSPVVTGFDSSGHVVAILSKIGKPYRFTTSVLSFDFSSRGMPDDLVAGRIHGPGNGITWPWAPIVYLRWGTEVVRYNASSSIEVVPLTLPFQVRDLVGAYRSYAYPDIGVVFLDTAGNLITWNNAWEHSPYTTSTAGLGFLTATAWTDVNQMLHVYGLDGTDTLKVLHQVDTSYNGGPVWSRSTYLDPPPPPSGPQSAAGRGRRHSSDPAKTVPSCVGLVPAVASFAVDPFPDYQPNELVRHQGTASPAEQFSFYAQDITSARWSRDKVRLPAGGAPHQVAHYVSAVTVLDRRGQPMPGLPVRVTADTLAEVQVEGASYLIGPGHAATVATNALGKVTIATAADTLLPPTLHVDATGLAQGAVVQPASAVHEYLAGTGALPSQNGRFGTDALTNAEADGRPIVDKDHEHNIQHVVDGTRQAFKKASGSLTSLGYEGAEAGSPIHGFSVGRAHTYRTGDMVSAVYRELHTEADFDAHITAIRNLPEYGGIWEDFAAWAGDVWEGVKNGVIEVYDVTVGAVAKVFVYIGEKVVELVGFVIDNVMAAARAVESLFTMVVSAVSKVVDWLKALFAFEHIWHTAAALETGFKQIMGFAASTVAQFSDSTHTWFQDQQTKVDTYFNALKVAYAGRPLGDAGNQIPAVAGPSGEVVPRSELTANPQATWMLDQATGARGMTGSGEDALMFRPDPAAQDAWDAFLARCAESKLTDHFSAVLGDLELLIKKIVDPADPDLAAKSSMTALIDIVQQLVQAALSALDFIIDAALTMLAAAESGLQAFLDTPMEVPVLQSLYDWVRKEADQAGPKKLTLGGLVFLVGGFGVTTLYKLVNGVDSEPFPHGWPQIPAPKWHPDYDPAVAWDSADGAAVAKFFQGIAGFCGLIGMPAEVVGDLLPLRLRTPLDPTWMFTAEKALTAVAVIFNTGFCGVLGSIPVINGNDWDGQGGCWKWAFGVQGANALASTVALLMLKVTSLAGSGYLKNTVGVMLGPAISAIVSGAYLTLAGTGSSRAEQPLYTRAQIGVSAVPGLAQIFRVKITPGSPESWIRAGVVSVIDFAGLGAAAGMTVAAACSPGPSILTPPTLPPASRNSWYEEKLSASGGDQNFNWGLHWKAVDVLPTWLTLEERADPKREGWKDTYLVGMAPKEQAGYDFSLVVSDNYAPPQTSDAVTFHLQVT